MPRQCFFQGHLASQTQHSLPSLIWNAVYLFSSHPLGFLFLLIFFLGLVSAPQCLTIRQVQSPTIVIICYVRRTVSELSEPSLIYSL